MSRKHSRGPSCGPCVGTMLTNHANHAHTSALTGGACVFLKGRIETMGTITIPPRPPNDNASTIQELKAIRLELAALRRMLDEFFGVLLNARFSGEGTDRWSGGDDLHGDRRLRIRAAVPEFNIEFRVARLRVRAARTPRRVDGVLWPRRRPRVRRCDVQREHDELLQRADAADTRQAPGRSRPHGRQRRLDGLLEELSPCACWPRSAPDSPP